MDTPVTLVWLRRDLRLADHPALAEAARRGRVVLAYVLDETNEAAPGGAARWWLHRSLADLDEAVTAKGGTLVFARGRAAEELPRLAAQAGADAVHWNRDWRPPARAEEQDVAAALARAGLSHRHFAADLLFEPGQVRTKGGGDFQVFTAFWRAALALPPPPPPLPAPARLDAPAGLPTGPGLDHLALMPRVEWWRGMAAFWEPGEAAAARRLGRFLDQALDAYAVQRDHPDTDGTSRLSPHLAFGEISPRQVWHAVRARPPSAGAETFLKELGWREFSHALLSAHPTLPRQPLRPEFAAFPWREDEDAAEAWRRGRTGYPIVDAGMRQLWRTGWMHNRVRMIVASFLIKDLLVPWTIGEDWFRDTLVDADLAANSASWQWVAGSGADAAPFFRVFNPVLQGEKFDPRGRYVRQYVPELAGLPDTYLHRPWEAPPAALAQAGIRLGITYPRPLVDHALARKRALAAFNALKGGPEPDLFG